MPRERVQIRIEQLLDQVEEAAAKRELLKRTITTPPHLGLRKSLAVLTYIHRYAIIRLNGEGMCSY
jgi:hypothetical protein